MASEITLYSMMICPFAQRTRIHLELVGLPFELVNLDICAPRPAWFLALNSAGQVPVLVRGDDIVCDSPVIADYIQTIATNPLPAGRTPERQNAIRSLVDYAGKDFIAGLYMLLAARTADERAARVDAALETFRWLDAFLAEHGPDDTAPPWLDGGFGVAEMMIAPFFLRYEVVRYYQEFEVPDAPGYHRVARWRDAMLEHPVVRSTAESVPDLIKLYEDYTLGFFNGAVPPDRDRSSLDLASPLADRPLPDRAASVL